MMSDKTALPQGGALVEDIVLFGRPHKGRKDGIGINRASLVLGEPGTVTAEDINRIRQVLAQKGIAPAAIQVRIAPKAPTEAELQAHKAKKSGPYDASLQREMRVVVDVGPLDYKTQHSDEWLDFLQSGQIAAPDVTAKARANVAEAAMTLSARIKRDGFVKAVRHEYAVSPIKLIGRLYFVGDILSFAVGLMNSVGTVKSRGMGDMIFGVACSATGVVMAGWGDRKDPNSPSQALMQDMDAALAGQPGGYPAADSPSLPPATTRDAMDGYLAQHASTIGKVGLIIASAGMFVAGVQQKNPIKMVQSFFASVGFPISLLMPKEGVRLQDTGVGEGIKNSPVAQKGFEFLQERPNALIGLAVIHNMLGFGTSAHDILRSEPNREAIRQQFADDAYQPSKSGPDGKPLKWWDLPRKELIAHARALGNEAFIDGVANYQMYNRLRLTAIPYALMVGTYFIGNALFGLTVEPKKRVHPDELLSLAAERWLRTADTSLAPEALAYGSLSALSSMARWLANQPAVRFAQQSGKLDVMEGEPFEQALARMIIAKAGDMAALTGQEGAYAVLSRITGPVFDSVTVRKPDMLAHHAVLSQPGADAMLASAVPPVMEKTDDQLLLGVAKDSPAEDKSAAAIADLVGMVSDVPIPRVHG
jgi:hypothetical protein